jgi:hypothetical protein
VVSQDLDEFGFGGGFGFAATAFDDPLPIRGVAEAGRGNPPLPGLVPVQPTISSTASLGHQAASASFSSNAMYS